MAVVRRHWKLAAANALLLAVALALLVHHLARDAGRALADPPSGSSSVDALTYSRVSELRERLMLTNADLAAMGCTQQQAKSVLAALLQWYQQNQATWVGGEGNERSARAQLHAALERAAVGPRNEALIAQISSLRQALTSAAAQRGESLNAAASAVQPLLTTSQVSSWTTARANKNVALRYRFVPNLTDAETKTLTVAVAKRGESSQAVAQVEQSVLAGSRLTAMQSALTNARESATGVMAADTEVLPIPTELRPSTGLGG
jgi:hypothetical protein